MTARKERDVAVAADAFATPDFRGAANDEGEPRHGARIALLADGASADGAVVRTGTSPRDSTCFSTRAPVSRIRSLVLPCSLALLVSCGGGGAGGGADAPAGRSIVVGALREDAEVASSIVTLAGQFGANVALSGDTLVVGAPQEQGAAFVEIYRKGAVDWFLEARIVGENRSDDGTVSGYFGYCVAISGDRLAVSEPVAGKGLVHLFRRQGSNWYFDGQIESDGVSDLADFRSFGGASLSLSGDTLVVGAPGAAWLDGSVMRYGAAIVYVRKASGWTLEDRITSPNPDPVGVNFGVAFGGAVAVSGETLVVGASQDRTGNLDDELTGGSDGPAGRAYVYTRQQAAWSLEGELSLPFGPPTAFDGFGLSVAIDGDTVAVGVEHAAGGEEGTTPGYDASGNAYDVGGAIGVFVRRGASWVRQAVIRETSSTPGLTLGFSVSISGDRIAAGGFGFSNETTPSHTGAAYVLERDGDTWSHVAYIRLAELAGTSVFGYCVAASADSIAVGAPFFESFGDGTDPTTGGPQRGSVYLFH